ncbi:hypothetical protein M5689_001491 [Euphorbia peplus]|nr:hypothetical protein M5689_001491 [Euphorbia peplus]
MVNSNCSSLPTSTYGCDPDVERAAWILMSIYSSSPRKFSPVPSRSKNRKHSVSNRFGEESLPVKSNENGLRNTSSRSLRVRSDDNLLVEESIPIMFDDRLVKEVMDTYDELVMERGVEDALKDLKIRYESSNVIIAGIESFEFLMSKGLDRDGILKVVNAIYEEEKKKINSDLVLSKKSPMKMKMKNVMDFTGEDDELKGNIKGHKCREYKEGSASYQALGGHTTSHNRKKKTEESIQTSSKVTKIEIVPGTGGENYEFLSSSKSQTYSSSSEEDRD